MTGTTAELGLPTGQDSDDLEVYLTSNPGGLVAALAMLDALFNAATGHAHGGPHQGAPVQTAGIANGSVTAAKIAAEAWTAFTPTLWQGAAPLTVTVNRAVYYKVGRLASVFIQLTAGAAGTAGSPIQIQSIPGPLTPQTANGAAPAALAYIGAAPPRLGFAVWISSAGLEIQVDNSSGHAGVAPAITLANGTVVTLAGSWETAS